MDDLLEELSAEKSANPEAAMDLLALMSEFSEEHYDAEWINHNEYFLYSLILIEGFKSPELIAIQDLSSKAKGWWHWVDGGLEFILLEDWIQLYEHARKFGLNEPCN